MSETFHEFLVRTCKPAVNSSIISKDDQIMRLNNKIYLLEKRMEFLQSKIKKGEKNVD